jgi:lipopolysaccharide/colanic/teichoic acid biosynthesis glycosyltransferase
MAVGREVADSRVLMTVEAEAALAPSYGGGPGPVLAPPPAAPTAPAERAAPRTERRLDLAAKRALDVVVAASLLLLLAPLWLLIVLAVVLDSRGPAFFRADRVGYRGRRLRMLKFRKMHRLASGPPLTMADDHRFTRVGRALARHKLDELPQLWHVFTGEMSLVGPRPETDGFVEHHAGEYERILTVRPGLIGWSQIAFAREGEILDDADPLGHYLYRILPQKVALDMKYARERSFGLDLRIIGWSLVAVLLRRQVAVHRQTGRMGLRRRK